MMNPQWFFFLGFGDEDEDRTGQSIMEAAFQTTPELSGPDIGEWGQSSVGKAQIATASIKFASPAARVLRKKAQTAVGEVVAPRDRAGDGVFDGADVVIHMPMTGDVGLSWRRKSYAAPLVERAGAVSVVMVAPNYGLRRPDDFPKGAAMPAITDMKGQALGIVTESLALAKYARKRGAKTVTFAGVSFGGNMAAFTSLLAKEVHGLAMTVGSDGPHAPFMKGIMKAQVPEEHRAVCDVELARIDLNEWLSDHDEPRRVIRMVMAKHDLYVPWDSAQALSQVMSDAPGTVSMERRVARGGHGTTIMRKHLHVDAIIGAIKDQRKLA